MDCETNCSAKKELEIGNDCCTRSKLLEKGLKRDFFEKSPKTTYNLIEISNFPSSLDKIFYKSSYSARKTKSKSPIRCKKNSGKLSDPNLINKFLSNL